MSCLLGKIIFFPLWVEHFNEPTRKWNPKGDFNSKYFELFDYFMSIYQYRSQSLSFKSFTKIFIFLTKKFETADLETFILKHLIIKKTSTGLLSPT
jgi:hypothetical protein